MCIKSLVFFLVLLTALKPAFCPYDVDLDSAPNIPFTCRHHCPTMFYVSPDPPFPAWQLAMCTECLKDKLEDLENTAYLAENPWLRSCTLEYPFEECRREMHKRLFRKILGHSHLVVTTIEALENLAPHDKSAYALWAYGAYKLILKFLLLNLGRHCALHEFVPTGKSTFQEQRMGLLKNLHSDALPLFYSKRVGESFMQLVKEGMLHHKCLITPQALALQSVTHIPWDLANLTHQLSALPEFLSTEYFMSVIHELEVSYK